MSVLATETETDTFIDVGGIMQVNEKFVTETITLPQSESVQCGHGCSEQAFGYDAHNIPSCYVYGRHPNFPMHKRIVYKS
jgi:hypothetical protein